MIGYTIWQITLCLFCIFPLSHWYSEPVAATRKPSHLVLYFCLNSSAMSRMLPCVNKTLSRLQSQLSSWSHPRGVALASVRVSLAEEADWVHRQPITLRLMLSQCWQWGEERWKGASLSLSVIPHYFFFSCSCSRNPPAHKFGWKSDRCPAIISYW